MHHQNGGKPGDPRGENSPTGTPAATLLLSTYLLRHSFSASPPSPTSFQTIFLRSSIVYDFQDIPIPSSREIESEWLNLGHESIPNSWPERLGHVHGRGFWVPEKGGLWILVSTPQPHRVAVKIKAGSMESGLFGAWRMQTEH